MRQGARESRTLPMDPVTEGGPVVSYEYPHRGQVQQQGQGVGPPCGQLVAWQAAPGTEQMGPGQLARVPPGYGVGFQEQMPQLELPWYGQHYPPQQHQGWLAALADRGKLAAKTVLKPWT